jgi:undecaprenyl-diphosphatase
MTVLEALFLGIIQGLTEFLPVSSSGHLVLFEHWFGLKVADLLSFDVVVHSGTLVALVFYFWSDLRGIMRNLTRKNAEFLEKSEDGSFSASSNLSPCNDVSMECPNLLLLLVVATVPVVLVAPFLKDVLESTFREIPMVVGLLGLTAVLLACAELMGRYKNNAWLSFRVALVMGLFQVLAMAPGVSRSGSTIVGGMLMGLSREKAARFSFLMAIPAIGGATLFLLKDIISSVSGGGNIDPVLSWAVLGVGFLSSAVVSALAMHFMLRFLRSRSLWVFVVYLGVLVGGYLLF